ncbi:MAG: hypothetical protein CMD18_04155 [Flavobacteriales bacterium]|nr:hypothetical protein [Flavobacteriales bacterium]|tara:strand:+ start:433 stop:2193 length:1761 start_codon:yes stop_codon:yes gene_type:complete
MKNNFCRKKIFAFVVVIIGLASCVEKRDLSQNTVIYHMLSLPESLHPLIKDSSPKKIISHYTQKYIHFTDVRTFKQIPILCKSLPDTIGDLQTYTFELKDNIRWDDETPLTGEDVIFSVKMMISPLTNNPGKRSIYTQVFENVWLDSLNPLIVYYKSKEIRYSTKGIFMEIPILQKSFWDKQGKLNEVPIKGIENFKFTKEHKRWFEKFNGQEYSFNPEKIVGLGAYQVTEYKVGSHVTLSKKKNHWTKGDTCIYNWAYPEKIIFKEISDKTGVKLALMNERVDAVYKFGPKTISKLQKKEYFNEKYYTVNKGEFVYTYLGFNMKPDLTKYKPLFVDQKVRRALAHAVPVDEIIEVIYAGYASVQVSNTNPSNYRYNNLKPIEYNLEKAKKLLKEAGWLDTNGDHVLDKTINGEKVDFKFKYSYMTGSSTGKETFLTVKENFKRIGVVAVGNPMEFATFYNKAQKHEFELMAGGWISGSGYSDPDQLWGVDNWENQGYNFTGFGDASSDSLIRQININIDEEKHISAHQAFQKRLYDDQPYIFLLSPQKTLVIHRRFENAAGYMQSPSILINTLKLKEEYKTKKIN